MSLNPAATLIVEVGTATTKLTLVDLVDNEFRLIARAETVSTLAEPEQDVTAAVLELAATIETITGRELVRDGQLLAGAGRQDGSIVVTTSAAGTMPVAIAALSAEQSARAAVNATRGSYATVEHIFALDGAGTADEQWLSREITMLARTNAYVILIAGGLEGGAVSALERIGHIVGLVAKYGTTIPQIIYAGNSAAAQSVAAALGDTVKVEIVENVRPAPGINRLEPARAALRQIYNARYLTSLPGHEKLNLGYIGTVAADEALIVRFLAERFSRNILALDVGATHGLGQLQAEGQFTEVVLANRGIGSGTMQIVDASDAGAILRWLPFELSPSDLHNRLLNRLLRPNIAPIDLDELMIEYALLREGLRGVVAALAEVRMSLQYDLVIAGGIAGRAPRPGLAALALLDSLPLRDETRRFAVDLYLDSLSLLPAAGALAHVDADAAACLIERDGLGNGPLATLIVPQGEIVEGAPVLDIELKTAAGEVDHVEVIGGAIARLELPRGQRGTLRIRPARGIAIGDNAAGTEVQSDEAAIGGSMLGVIVDARPRPLMLPDEPAARAGKLIEWMKALDALPPVDTTGSTPAWYALDGAGTEAGAHRNGEASGI
ncbi:MAG TPA: glutamate mutase L [Herpetosiphonaceae bacterium]|nr:glutamate mutase L [Herpetosiphonaceae bacterium]